MSQAPCQVLKDEQTRVGFHHYRAYRLAWERHINPIKPYLSLPSDVLAIPLILHLVYFIFFVHMSTLPN